MSSELILFNKPFGVLCQFTDTENRPTLADYIKIPDVYAAGRLDKDSEGLLLLTSDGKLQHRITDPQHKKARIYRVQVEGEPDVHSLEKFRRGLHLKDGKTRPAGIKKIDPPRIWSRDPPVRFRQNIPTTWLEVTLYEGKNRQVRRMTANIGFPTLRLVRWCIGELCLDDIPPGQWKKIRL